MAEYEKAIDYEILYKFVMVKYDRKPVPVGDLEVWLRRFSTGNPYKDMMSQEDKNILKGLESVVWKERGRRPYPLFIG